MKKTAHILALLLLLAPAAGGAEAAHSLLVSVSNNGQHFNRYLQLTEGEESSYSGEMKKRQVDFSVALTRSGRLLKLSYRVSVAGIEQTGERSLLAEGGLFISPGGRLTALRCGPWAVAFTLDRVKGKRLKTLDSEAGLKAHGNYRVSSRLSQGEKTRCVTLSAPDTEASVSDFMQSDEERRGVSFWMQLSGPAKDGAFTLDYRADDNFSGDLAGRAFSGSLLLTPGKKTASVEEEEGVPGPVFLLEGSAPARAE